MAKEQKPLEGLAATPAQSVEKTMKQVEGILENYFSWLQGTMAATPWGKTDLVEKYRNYTEHNIAAALDCVHQLSQAKDLQDVFRIQTEFVQTQMSAIADQTRGLGESYMKALTGAMTSASVRPLV
jgi:hypothetical protein